MCEEEPKWQLVEKIVAILEKALTPTAKVEHNVKLPVLGKPNRKPRQCDVVITYSKAPRQAVAIVEVQDRASKPDITTFHGWIEKMHEVGAQQLICVSALGYPQSIVDEVATRFGPTVKLMTLEQLQEARIQQLIFVVPYVIHKHPHISFESVGPVELENPPQHIEEFELNPTEKVFSQSDAEEQFSLIELVDRLYESYVPGLFLQQGVVEPNSYSLLITLGSFERDLWLHLGESRLKVLRLPIRLLAETRVTEIPLSVRTYQQEFIDDTLAWIVSANAIVEGKEVGFQIVFKRNDDGFLQLASVWREDVASVELMLSPSESVIRKVISRDNPL
jgi:hypothetical protein